MRGIGTYLLARFDSSDYLTRKKASLVMFFAITVIVLLNAAAFASFTVSIERAIQFFSSSIPASIFACLTLYFLRKGKLQLASNIFVILCSAIVFFMFLAKQAEISFVSLKYFMFVTILFAAVFSSRKVTTGIFLSYIAADIIMFIHKGMKLPRESLRSTRTFRQISLRRKTFQGIQKRLQECPIPCFHW